MAKNKPKYCPECKKEQFFEGLCYDCGNRKKRERYESMTEEEVKTTIDKIIAEIETMEDYEDIYDDFRGLLAYKDINTEEIAKVAFQNKVFFPTTMYRSASAETQNQLIETLLTPECEHIDDILSCLSEIGNDKSAAVFFNLEKNPFSWKKQTYVPPSFYLELGGWTLDESGKRIELNYDQCYSLLEEDRKDTAVQVAEAKPETCSICSCQTVNILIIDGLDKRLSFLGIKGKVKIPICPNCASMCEKTIIRYTIDGESTFEIVESFGDENYISKEDFEKFTTNKFVLSQSQKPIYFACANDEVSTIGGKAEWVQSWQYENCPDCQKKMKLLSSLSWNQVYDGSEGTLYIQICTDCSVVVAFHSQT